MDEGEFQRRFRELQERFLAKLPDDRALLAQLMQNPADRQAKLKSLAHQYNGTGATFGFPDISDIAHRLDEALVTRASPSSITALCRELCAAFDRALEDGV